MTAVAWSARRRLGSSLAFTLAAWVAPGPGHAAELDPSTPRLEWVAPPECIGRGELERAVTQELGRPAFDANGRELVVRGYVVRTPGGPYRAAVTLARVSGAALGVRNIASDDATCRSLDEALIVMLGIMLNVGRAELAAPPPSPWSFRLGLGGAATLGRMPGPGVELALSGGPALPGVVDFGAELAVETGPSRDIAEGSVHARALSGRVAVSPVLLRGSPELALHAAVGGGVVAARADGFASSDDGLLGVVDVRGGARLSLRLARPLWLEIAGDVGFYALRPEFSVKNADGTRDTLFEPGPVFGTLGLGLAYRPP